MIFFYIYTTNINNCLCIGKFFKWWMGYLIDRLRTVNFIFTKAITCYWQYRLNSPTCIFMYSIDRAWRTDWFIFIDRCDTSYFNRRHSAAGVDGVIGKHYQNSRQFSPWPSIPHMPSHAWSFMSQYAFFSLSLPPRFYVYSPHIYWFLLIHLSSFRSTVHLSPSARRRNDLCPRRFYPE